MATIEDLANVIETVIDDKLSKTKKQSDSVIATVNSKDVDGTIWVTFEGGVEKTPITTVLADVEPGDRVAVRIENGRSYIDGNATSPSASGRTVNVVRETAETAQYTADDAAKAAESAIEDATIAKTAAASAQESADKAETAATAATTAAGNAQIAANAATFALSDVEKVVGTLEWIAEHGEYELTEDTAVVAGKVYYTRSGTSPNYTYTVVAEPKTAEIATYYELHLDESVQNFIATHLWLDAYGLNLSVDSSNGYRIHQGTVDGTKAMGVYVLDATGAIVASFGANGFQVGTTGESHLVGDYHSLQLVDRNGNTFYHISDLRNENGFIVDEYVADGSQTRFQGSVRNWANTEHHVRLDNVEITTGFTWTNGADYGPVVSFDTPPTNGSIVTIEYYPYPLEYAKAYTVGLRKSDSGCGMMSYAEGVNCEASGYASHAEGFQTAAVGRFSHAEGHGSTAGGTYSHAEGKGCEATGNYCHAEGDSTTANWYANHAEGQRTTATRMCSHAEGQDTTASANWSHAQNLNTIAASQAQTAIGKYNVEDANGDYALIIGNGRSDSARSNALAVKWSGDVECGAVNGVDVTAIPIPQSGVVATRSVAAGSVETVSITFPEKFAAAPNVVCGLQSTQTQLMGNCSCVVTARSTTGFTVALVNNSTSSRNLGCYWIAM